MGQNECHYKSQVTERGTQFRLGGSEHLWGNDIYSEVKTASFAAWEEKGRTHVRQWNSMCKGLEGVRPSHGGRKERRRPVGTKKGAAGGNGSIEKWRGGQQQSQPNIKTPFYFILTAMKSMETFWGMGRQCWVVKPRDLSLWTRDWTQAPRRKQEVLILDH